MKPIEAIELREGESIDLIGTVEPANANNQDLVWTSGDPKVVSVSEIGRVTAIALPEGKSEYTVSITAMAADGSGAKATCEVTVKQKIPVESITVSPTTWSGNIGSTTSLTATISPETATVQDITWESDRPDVATVSPYGIVTAEGPGEATITAKTTDGSGKFATCSVHVNDKIPVESVKLSAGPSSGKLYIGQQFSFNAILVPKDATNQELIWESSDPEIANVSSYGLVTALKEGEVTITAIAADDPDQKAFCTIEVCKPVPVEIIQIVRANDVVTSWPDAVPGERRDIRARINPSDATYKAVIWSSSDESVATVKEHTVDTNSDPVKYGTSIAYVYANKKGTATIKATSVDNPKVSTTYEVTVN